MERKIRKSLFLKIEYDFKIWFRNLFIAIKTSQKDELKLHQRIKYTFFSEK